MKKGDGQFHAGFEVIAALNPQETSSAHKGLEHRLLEGRPLLEAGVLHHIRFLCRCRLRWKRQALLFDEIFDGSHVGIAVAEFEVGVRVEMQVPEGKVEREVVLNDGNVLGNEGDLHAGTAQIKAAPGLLPTKGSFDSIDSEPTMHSLLLAADSPCPILVVKAKGALKEDVSQLGKHDIALILEEVTRPSSGLQVDRDDGP
mmetsp:Transcript_66708/g.145465  ORF Transcript_66708/g.145465 Transcript_66708/m.145465 type:complete len:201 (+) Transcript_66708:702-1304(+)